ncbi:MAG TPA: 5-oxoprolinase subunit PxpB, partial [Vicinamibacteria bacterium]|nr:5-oxoprolinase subunit PxpB [Vicinamibacteria bacterium]
MGDSALTVEFGPALTPEANQAVRALDSALLRAPFPSFRESVPTLRSLLVLYDGAREDFEEARDHVLGLLSSAEDPSPCRVHVIPTLYGGEGGPDLEEVARTRGLAKEEVVRLHSESDYVAWMTGFTPGFAYLGSLPHALETPRRARPRLRVPAGSVGIAGALTGIYPVASPGGWNLIGLTRIPLFDPAREPPALIQPGDRVRFARVSELPPLPAAKADAPPCGEASMEVLEGGLLTTVQDAGRAGFRRAGVGGAGPVDPSAHAAANRLAGNPGGAALLEVTLAGPTLRFLSPVRFALGGADLGAILMRADLGEWPCPRGVSVRARPGNVLRFAGRRLGVRAYLAFEGGIDVLPVLGSRSTDVLGGFGGFRGRPLRPGDRLFLGSRSGARETTVSLAEPGADVVVRVVLG